MNLEEEFWLVNKWTRQQEKLRSQLEAMKSN